MALPYLAIVTILSKTRHLSYNTVKGVGTEVSITVNDPSFRTSGESLI